MTVNFRAKFVQRTNLPDSREVSFVEINPKSSADVEAMKKLSNEWYDANYAKNIYEDVVNLSSKRPRIASRVFALTSQKENFKNIESRQILGIAEMTAVNNRTTPYLEYLQVDPLMKKSGVGTSILNVLKKMHDSIELNSAVSSVGFYKKNGFELVNPARLLCKWVKK